MKILILCSRVPFPLKDGGAIAMHQMIKGLIQTGNEVSVLALNTQKHFVTQEVINTEFADCVSFETVSINTEIKPIKALLSLLGSGSYNIERFWSTKFRELLVNKVQSDIYDVIQFEGLFVADYVHCIPDFKGVKSLRQHNVEHQIWERLAKGETFSLRKVYLSILAKRMKTYELKALQYFDSLLPISTTDLDFFSEHYSGNTYLTPVGVASSGNKSEFSQNCYHIGSMEWLPNREGVRWFIEEVWPGVLKQVPNALFFVAGKRLENFKLSEVPGVVLCGEVESLEDFVKDKSILVVPLLSGSGIRVKTLEALGQGKVVLSTSIGAKGIKENDGILLADSAQEFMNKLVEVLNNKEDWIKRSKNGKSFIESKYNTQEIMDGLHKFYLSLC